MKCPTCTTIDLVMSERQGIEIDYCPTCRGVWLDRGELDKVIERSAAAYAAQPVAAQAPQTAPVQPQPQQFFGHHGKDHDHDHGYGYGKHGKRSFLKDLFD
jgi:hypothetical protein